MDNLDSLREINIRFWRLPLSQKAAIVGKLNLLEEADADQPHFEMFRRALIRARDRGLIEALDRELDAVGVLDKRAQRAAWAEQIRDGM